MTPETRTKAALHAQSESPREACGLVIVRHGREIYHPCKNLSTNGNQFIMAPDDYALAEGRGEVIAVVHSHPYASPEPSEADRAACEQSGLPWHIVSVPGFEWVTIEPSGWRAPLIGREFHHGVLDCYTLIQDWYAENMGVTLPTPYRADGWWNVGENLYLDNFAAAGFERVMVSDDKRPNEFKVGDILLMQICSPVPNHGAIWNGDGTISHHLANMLSSRDVYGGYFRKHTTHVLRYTHT
ncbi:MAG TPA: C40 family peptidase [Acidocella sp.]|nr:C40 family peptidase [Acidocella sp.]